MRKLKGSITIFLALIFLSVLALVCVLIESVRIYSAETRAYGVTAMAVDSCFAKYGRELFDDYGILYLWNTESELLDTYSTVAGLNCDVDKGLDVRGSDIYGLSLKNVSIDRIDYCTDDNGQGFENQIYEYMIEKIGADAADELLKKIDLLSQGEKAGEFYNSIKSCKDEFSDAETAVLDIKDSIDEVKSIEGSPAENIESIVSKTGEIGKISDIQYISSLKEQIRAEYDNYHKWSTTVGQSLQDIKKSIEKYKQCSLKAKEAVEKLSEKAEGLGKELDSDIYDAIKSQVKDMSDKFNENDGYGVIKCEESLNALDEKLNQINNDLDIFVNADMNACEELNDASGLIKEFSMADLGININCPEVQAIKSDVEREVDSLWEKGILNLVTDSNDEISENQVDLSELPSKDLKTRDETLGYGMQENLIRKAVFGEYILTHFGCYTDSKSDTPLKYEVEYILEGNSDDKANLKKVVEKLIAVRGGFNIISIYKDAQKMNDAYAVAASVAGITGMPLAIKAVQTGIIIAWAGAESIIDIRNLLKGQKVALVKSPQQWNLSLTNLSDLKSSKKNEDDAGGLSYNEYLRYFLSLSDREDQVWRTMDIIELDISNKYNKNFKMKDCIAGISMTSGYQIKKLFSVFVPEAVKKDIYDIEVDYKYSY